MNIMQTMMKLQQMYPQIVGQMQNLAKSNTNPTELYQQIMKDKTPQQIENFYKFAKSYGVNDDLLSKLQNGGK